MLEYRPALKMEYKIKIYEMACFHLTSVSVFEIRHNILILSNLRIPLLKCDHINIPVKSLPLFATLTIPCCL